MNDDQKKYLYYAIPIVVVIALGGALYYGKRHKEGAVATQTATQAPADATANESPEHHPIETPPATAPLPALADSDPSVEQSLTQVFGPTLDRYLVPKDIVRHVVVTSDNLPRKKNAVQMWPVKPLGGELKTSTGNELTLNEANYERYKPLVKLATTADTKQLVAMYKRFYPLFQQAYVDLGYPEGYFNNRLVEVIDHLLETPEVEGQVKLVQPGVFYEFADPSLESRSSGQKLLMRMGRDNAAAVKLKLRELRREIAQREQ
jgi:Protein of unknown function (DUF3014)